MKIPVCGSSPWEGCIQSGWAPGVGRFSAAGSPEDSVRLASEDPAGHSSSQKVARKEISKLNLETSVKIPASGF